MWQFPSDFIHYVGLLPHWFPGFLLVKQCSSVPKARSMLPGSLWPVAKGQWRGSLRARWCAICWSGSSDRKGAQHWAEAGGWNAFVLRSGKKNKTRTDLPFCFCADRCMGLYKGVYLGHIKEFYCSCFCPSFPVVSGACELKEMNPHTPFLCSQIKNKSSS